MKTVVVGDIHGRLAITHAFLGMASDDTRVVFLGDFLDSYHESPDDQVQCLIEVLDACDSENVLACKGNHEISYLNSREICSGWKNVTQSLVDSVGKYRIEKTLLDYVWVEGKDSPILISHAGVTAAHFDKEPEHITVPDVEDFLENSPLVDREGYARGGNTPVGGIYWCDWWYEFDPIPAIRQIVGHSNSRPRGAHRGVVTKGENYNIDCLGRQGNEYVVIDEDGNITVDSLGDF